MGRSAKRRWERSRAAGWWVAVALAVPAGAHAQGTLGLTNGGDPPERVARLSALVGSVSFQTAGSDSWSQPALNYTVTSGDRLYAARGGRAELDIGGSAVRLGDAADVTVTNLSDHFTQLGVASGEVRTSIYRWNPSDSFELDTPNGTLLPLSAGSYRVTVNPDADVTTVAVERGTLEVTGPGLSRTLRGGQVVQLSGSNPVAMTILSSAADDDFERWALARDPRFGRSAQYVSQDMPGWEDLDQYGTWYPDPTNGPVWYPTAVAADWVPYREGHWAWVDPWGWTWVDDAPWGFAPFHYGRWAHLQRGWAWLPGPVVQRPVFAPALVVFVDGSSFADRNRPGVQAWFPLGPREPYFPWYHHSDAYLRQVNATNLRNVPDIDRVIHVRDVDQIRWQNRTVATTAVREETLRNGGAVSRDVIQLRPEQVAAARVAPHPSVNPEPRLVAGGPPAPRPPTIARPVMVAGSAAQRRGRMEAPTSPLYGRAPQPSATPQPPTTRTATVPPAAPPPIGATRPTVEPPRVRAPTPTPPPRAAVQAPAAGEVVPVKPPPPAARPIITRNPPPPPPPPAAAQQRAMQAHPGRPLEPQQVEAIRAGRSAGPARDAEVPPHPVKPAAPTPPARGQSAVPPARGQPAAPPARGQPPTRPPEPAHPLPPKPPDKKPPALG